MSPGLCGEEARV
jgi:hypothetical protein